MPIPGITIQYLVPLVGIFSALSLSVVVLRTRHNIPYGDGGQEILLHAIRAHGNFAEWVPMALLVIAALELTGASNQILHALLGTLVAARVLHPIGLYSSVGSAPYMIGRVSGAFSTWAVLTIAAVLLATRL